MRFLIWALVPGGLLAQNNVSTTVIDDVFASGKSQVQDLANASMWLFNGRNGVTVRTDQTHRPDGVSVQPGGVHQLPDGSAYHARRVATE
jgi:hypothetical protein